MTIDWFGVLDLGLGFGVLLGLSIWELRSLRRSQRRDREREPAAADERDRPR